MRALVTSDTHFTDRPQDSYRLGLWPWLRNLGQELDVDYILHLGDLTEKKDYHSAALVNRIADEIRATARRFHVIMLRGNHDGNDEENPFFRFLDKVGQIDFVMKPTERTIDGQRVVFLPHSRNPDADWAGIRLSGDLCFLHQTLSGARGENGTKLDGIKPSTFKFLTAISGDIHGPQQVGPVEYVGAPYHIDFGDDFDPRVLLLDEDGTTKSYRFPAPRKHKLVVRSAADLKKLDLHPGDQARVEVVLRREDFAEWSEIRQGVLDRLKADAVNVYGCEVRQAPEKAEPAARERTPRTKSPAALIREHAKREQLADEVLAKGLEIVGARP